LHITRAARSPQQQPSPKNQHPPPKTKGYLANDAIDLTFQTAFREGGTAEKPSVALYVAKHPAGWPITPNNVEMQVGATSGVSVVATALAQRIREGVVPCLTGIGVDAVSNCVLAIGHTRLALEPDGLDIRARPEFIQVAKNGTDLNAIKLHIHVDRI
jgi:stage V sporulation protein SpoVS